MIRCLAGLWSLVSRVIWSLVSRPAGEALQDSEIEQSPLPSPIIRRKDGEGSEQKPLFWTSSPIQKLNDHIYELYKPNGEPAMEILFFHGLQFGDSGDTYLSTWITGDGSRKVWPGTWLAEKFPNARIVSVSYDSSVRTTADQGRYDLFMVAENLMHSIRLANIGQGFRRPVVLVGHSFGGLVMKQLCVKADQQHSLDPNSEENQKVGKFLRNMGGLFFYGTPHRGITLPPLAAHFLDSPLLDYMKLLSAEGARLETIFNDVCKKYKTWHIASVGESLKTTWGPFHLLVVPEASARYSTDFCTLPADHISICKPANQTSNSFQFLINFIPKVEGGAQFDNLRLLPKAAVGLDVGVEVVCKMLQKNATVAIHGMGGVGKTTLAKAVFNELGPTFEYTCFCPDVKLMKGTVQDVEKEIWEHMYWDGKKVAEKYYDWSKFTGKRLLLILDDVARNIDLEVLPQVASVVAAESRFILTCRDKEILKDADDVEFYKVPFLSKKDAKPLFLSYAFPNHARPPLALENHIDVVIMKCEGLPLTLEVLGKCLKGRQGGEVWEQTIEVLHKAESVLKFDERLWEKLRLSYIGLPKEEQQMFLDATTFFSSGRWTLRDAKTAWSVSYGFELLRWQSLVDASLVYDVEDCDPIKVHEQLRSLGTKIASENVDKDGRRVWNGLDGLNLLQDESDVQEIHSLLLSRPEHVHLDPINIPSSSLLRFKRLQYLDVDDEVYRRMVSQGNEIFHTDLVLLRSLGLQFAQFHFDLAHLSRLAILVLTGYDKQSLPNSFDRLVKLKILKIQHASALETLPDNIGYLSKLERLEFVHCWRLTTLPNSFGSLSALNHLKFYNCENLDTLPESFGGLSHLNHLEFSFCKNLRTLPKSFGCLSALNHLQFNDCESLRTPPESFRGLSALNHLEFFECKSLHTLPESLGSLSTLNHLDLSFCAHLRTLPESFGSLSALKHLNFYDCENLNTLPESFGSLCALNHLEFHHCGSLHTLPESFGSLRALNHLEFHHSGSLHTLPESFGSLSALNHLEFYECGNSETVPESQTLAESSKRLSNIKYLGKRFDITHSQNFLTLPESLGKLSALNHFEISKCPIVTLSESFGGLYALNHFEIKDCPKFLALPESFGALSALKHVVISKCPELRSLPDSFGGLSAHLDYLELNDCRKLESLPDSLSDLKALRHLRINLIALTSIPDYIKGLQSLQILELGSLPYLKGLPLWLGETLLPPVVTIFQKFFRAQDGHFSQRDWDIKYMKCDIREWLHTSAMDKAKALDYVGALACLGAVNDLDHRLGVDVDDRLFILRERCIIKRDMGDLQGALEELNLGLEEQRSLVWKEEGTRRFSLYGFLKHRGFVRSLLGDDEGARDDAEEALKVMVKRRTELLRYLREPRISLEDQPLTYLNFKFPGYQEMEAQEKLMNLKMKSSFEKLRASDFGGALEDLNTVDDGLLWPPERGFFLRERGVLKRLTRDFGGALEDLNTAFDCISKYAKDDERISLDFSADYDEYISPYDESYRCLKHRGYVKRLLGDIDGARADAQTAWQIRTDAKRAWQIRMDSSDTDECSDTEELEEADLNDFDGQCSVLEQAEIDPVDFSFRDPPVYYLGFVQAALEGRLVEIDPVDFGFRDPPVYDVVYEGEV